VHVAHELDGVEAKLARADAHLTAVEAAVREVVESEPDLIQGVFEPRPPCYVFRAQRDSRSPTWISPIIGDCVHNFRAALDFLVWELVAVEGNVGDTKTEFPIFTDPARYATGAHQKIRGVPDRAEAIFRRLQPFAGPNSQPGSPLWRDPLLEPLALLYDLDRWDKHRSLNLTEDVVSASLVGFEQLGILVPPTPASLPGRFDRGMILAVAQVADGSPDVPVHLRAAYDIAFDRNGPAAGEPVLETLRRIRQEVRERIVPAFAAFFPTREAH
jgi:hypothetical protein